MAVASAFSSSLLWMRLIPQSLIPLPPFSLGLRSLWEELVPSIFWAVPKKKTSHSRKRMRSANKGLEDKTSIVNCPGCGKAKLTHHICPSCYADLNHHWKATQRESRQRAIHPTG